jgi:hypothetical protein
MKPIRPVCLAIWAALLAAPQAEAIDPCFYIGIMNFMPAHPGSTEIISWWNGLGLHAAGPVYVQTNVTADHKILFVFQIGIAPPAIPPYELLGPYPYMGHLGPLPVGDYSVSVSLAPGGCVLQQSTLTVSAQPAPTTTASVIEYYNATLDQYHSTLNAPEIQDLDTGVHSGWARTGQSFMAYVPGQDDDRGVIVQRWYGRPEAGLNSHFLTWVFAEEDALSSGFLAGAWIFENGATFVIPVPLATTGACPAGTQPVYRLWNNRPDSGHRYTADKPTKQAMVSAGYVAEGFGSDAVFMCGVTTPIH